jgi:hypothetical protein
MYTKALRTETLNAYSQVKGLLARFLRFQYPHDYVRPVIRTEWPGPQAIEQLQQADAAQSYDASRTSVSDCPLSS